MSPLELMQRLAALVPQGPPAQAQEETEAAAAGDCDIDMVPTGPHRISRARLLKRVSDINMQHCPNCGAGALKIIAAILGRPMIQKILDHLGLDPQPPPKGRAHEPRTSLRFLSRAPRCGFYFFNCRARNSQPPAGSRFIGFAVPTKSELPFGAATIERSP